MTPKTLNTFSEKWGKFFMEKMKNPSITYYKRGAKFIQHVPANQMLIPTATVRQFWREFREVLDENKQMNKKCTISKELIAAVEFWWKNSGQVPSAKVAKIFGVGDTELTLYIQAQMFEKASTGELPESGKSTPLMYYAAYYGRESDFHFFK